MIEQAGTPFLEDFAATLLAELESGPRARATAVSVFDLVPESAVIVYLVNAQGTAWVPKAAYGEIATGGGSIALDSGTLGSLAQERTAFQVQAEDLSREDFAHLDLRQSFRALTYIPILLGEQLLGGIEIVSFSEPPSEATLATLVQVADCAAVAFGSSLLYESERNAGLSSVLRLTQLYDIEKVFNTTLEMQELLSIICDKVQDLTGSSAVNLWMVDQTDLLLVHQAGEDAGAKIHDRQEEGAGIVAAVSEDGQAVLYQAEDEPLERRNSASGAAAATSLMAAALLHGEDLTGVLEVVSYDPDLVFDENDLFTLTQIADSAAQALHNSSLLQAERKIEVMQTLVSISQEIGSTLNLQRVLDAIVNQPQLVIPYERSAIALEQRNKLTIQAVSGVTKLDASAPEIETLGALLRWVAGLETEIHVSQQGEELSDSRPETREKFRRYFEASGSRGFYAVPLSDEEGTLGVLSFESSDPDFLTPLHFEIIKILVSQATLALRNASLYKEVPFIGILEPLIEKRRRFMAIEKRRRALILTAIVAVFLILVLVPFPMRVSGPAEVAPSQTQYVRAEEDSVVEKVLVREGEKVLPGAALVQMNDWRQRAAVNSAEAKYNIASSQVNRALVSNDLTGAGQHQLETDYLRGEVMRSNDRLSRMTLHAAIPGLVATPHVEDLAGKKFLSGDPLMELVSTDDMIVDVAVSERDVELLKTGAPATVKLDSFPTRTFRGSVNVISPSGQIVGENRVFFARIDIVNSNGDLKSGMQGFGKIRIGARPLGYVLFRDPALWFWSKLWNWFSW